MTTVLRTNEAEQRRPIPPVPPITWSSAWPWALALVITGVYSLVSIVRYEHGTFTSWDLAIFTQTVESWAHGHWPVSSVRGGPGFATLGDHFSPALAVLAPGYRLFPSPVFLLVAQAALFGASVVPIARFAVRRLGQPAAALIAVAYGVSWGLQQAVVVDFHEVALAVPLLAAGTCALAERRWRVALAWLLPLVLVKEDLGLTVAAVGLYLLLQRQWRPGAAVAVFGAVATAVQVELIIPAISRDGSYPYDDKLGGDHSLPTLLAHTVWPDAKLTTLFFLLGATAFVCLRSPLVLLAVPTLLWRNESDNAVYWGHEWHYSAVLMPIVFVAAVDGLHRLRSGRSRRAAAVAVPIPAVIATIAVMSLPSTPLADYDSADAYRVTARERMIDHVEALIPQGASVETDVGLMAHLTAGRHTYFVGNHTASVTPQYIVTDQSAWSVTMQGQLTVQYAHQLHPNAAYNVVLEDQGVTVVRLEG